MEQQNLQREFDQLSQQIQLLRRLVSDRRELLKALKKDLRSLKRKYGDQRRTKLGNSTEASVVTSEHLNQNQVQETPTDAENVEENLLNLEPTEVLEFTHRGYVRRSALTTQRSTRKQKAENGTPENDLVIQTNIANTQQDLLVLTSGGKVYPVQVGNIPPTTGRSERRGTPLVSLLPSAASAAIETVISHFFLPDDPETAQMVLLTQMGRIKRLSLAELVNLTGRGLTMIKFKDDDQLLSAQMIQPGQEIVLATAGGRLLRFVVNDEQLPVMGRIAVGLQALRLRKQEQVLGCVTSAKSDDNLLLVSQMGYAKRMPLRALRRANRGDIGTQALYFNTKSDALAGIVIAPAAADIALLTSTHRVIRLPVDSVTLLGKDGKGERIPSLNPDETITTATILA